MWQYWLGNTKLKKAFRLILNVFKKLLQNFLNKKNYLTEFSTDWLTACLPADSRNSTMAKATSLIFSLFDVASAREVPFAIPLYIQYVLHGLSMALLCVSFIFVHHEKCQFSGRHVMASIKLSVIFIVATLITKVLLLLHNGLNISGNEASSFQTINTQVGRAVRLFRCSINGFTSNNKAAPLYCIFHNHNHIGVATQRAGGLQPHCEIL